MTLPPLDKLKKLQTEVTPGPWKWDNPGVCPKNVDGDIVRLTHGQGEANRQLISLAPPLLAEVIRLREALEKQLGEINLVIALADMIQPQTEAQQTATTLARDLCDDLTRILNGDTNE